MIRISAQGFLPPSAGVSADDDGAAALVGVLASGAAGSGGAGGVASGGMKKFGGTALGGGDGAGAGVESGTFAMEGCEALKPILLDRSLARFARLRNSKARHESIAGLAPG